ncbi:unnamed protein product [Parascedosporium putredinis]|uniref:Uncharacterized protein n=1 Tax=Parascedosporium putredinis TaxID=1442378 RepID=A0A9P1HAQ4_9PEZI|nr:unnamed protein product [Parascedosporium putredinis]CAI8001373.1 unnamed protein product [Parascedosporium putredinis]
MPLIEDEDDTRQYEIVWNLATVITKASSHFTNAKGAYSQWLLVGLAGQKFESTGSVILLANEGKAR